jgi:hypothetical protein
MGSDRCVTLMVALPVTVPVSGPVSDVPHLTLALSPTLGLCVSECSYSRTDGSNVRAQDPFLPYGLDQYSMFH